jgi:hypothetical protein
MNKIADCACGSMERDDMAVRMGIDEVLGRQVAAIHCQHCGTIVVEQSGGSWHLHDHYTLIRRWNLLQQQRTP